MESIWSGNHSRLAQLFLNFGNFVLAQDKAQDFSVSEVNSPYFRSIPAARMLEMTTANSGERHAEL